MGNMILRAALILATVFTMSSCGDNDNEPVLPAIYPSGIYGLNELYGLKATVDNNPVSNTDACVVVTTEDGKNAYFSLRNIVYGNNEINVKEVKLTENRNTPGLNFSGSYTNGNLQISISGFIMTWGGMTLNVETQKSNPAQLNYGRKKLSSDFADD